MNVSLGAFASKVPRRDDPKLKAELERIGPPKSDVAAKSKEWGVKPLSVEKMAEKADKTLLYLSTYPVLSDTVHAGIRDPETRHVETSDGEIVTLKIEPKVDSLEILFLTATEFLIPALEGFASFLNLDLGEFCEESKRSLKALVDTHLNG